MFSRIRPVLLTFIGLFLFLGSDEQGTPPDYSITNYNSDNALPQNSIKDMAFDRNGFLWLVTETGVVRFDGKNFREYDMRNSPALTTNRCTRVFLERSSGDVLIEAAADIHRYLRVTADYELIADSTVSNNPFQWHFPNLHVFNFSNLFKKAAHGDTSAFGGLFNGFTFNTSVLTVNETHAYVVKGEAYYYLDENAAVVQPLRELSGHALKIQFMVGDIYICVDKQDRLYAYKDGRLQNITGSSRLMSFLDKVDISGPYPIQSSIRTLRDSYHTFLTHKGDILLLNISHGLLDYDTLAANTPIRNIHSLIYDEKNKIIYAGTATSGLYILKKREFQRLFFSSDNFVINSLYAQLELPDGRILTSSGILGRKGKTSVYLPGIDRPTLLRSSDGHIWYSSYGWIKRMDTDLRHSEDIVSLGDVSRFGIWASVIAETDNKDILCSSDGYGKLYRIRGKDATVLLDVKKSLNNAEIFALLPLNDTDLWIGTTNGVYSYNLSTAALTRLPGLENAVVRTIHRSGDGSLWIGTYGQGFYRYRNGRFLKMPMDAANNLTNVHCFMEDRKGYFWLPTNRGLFRVAKNDLDSFAAGGKDAVYYYYFDKSSGFSSNEFNGGCTPCGIVTSDGGFSLPSLDGLIQFNPDSITVVPPDHPIFIERFATDNKRMIAGDYFALDQDAGPIVFSISSPYYGNPANLHLEYSIPELDDRWHPVSNDGKLILTGLRKGRYTLAVRKQEGYARYGYKTVQWTILPYWYETIWFRLLAAVVIIGILFIIFYLRYSEQVRRAEKLEKKVAERTEALSENNKVKEKMIAIILHDLRSPLRFLHMLAVHIYENHQSTTGPELDDMLLKFQNATRDLYEFTQDFVVWTNAQKEGFVVRQEKIVLREIVEEIVKLYEAGADIRNNNVLNLVPGAITMTSDPHILKLLIRNLTDNANKYTLNGDIRIEAGKDDSAVRITITDTGRSMDKELVAGILNNTYQSEDSNQGFGYKIILELLAKIQGRLLIDNADATGNRITLLFQGV